MTDGCLPQLTMFTTTVEDFSVSILNLGVGVTGRQALPFMTHDDFFQVDHMAFGVNYNFM